MTADVNNLKDVYLTVPFVCDEQLFQLERNAISRPIKIVYDDYVIRRFNLPTGSTSVMLNNVMSGELPTKLFWCEEPRQFVCIIISPK